MISFLISALNEEKNIEATIKNIQQSINKVKFVDNFEIVIINDGSTDSTEEVVKKIQLNYKNIIYLKNDKNSGIGTSIKKGLNEIKYSKFMILPGDNDMPIEAIIAALKHMHLADLILVFPVNTDVRSKTRNIISGLYRLSYLAFFNCYVNYINAPSICPTAKVKDLNLHSKRFSIISEITTKLLNSDLTYGEVPAFFSTTAEKRNTVTLKSLLDVCISFTKLFIEMKIKDKNKFLKKSKRLDVYQQYNN